MSLDDLTDDQSAMVLRNIDRYAKAYVYTSITERERQKTTIYCQEYLQCL